MNNEKTIEKNQSEEEMKLNLILNFIKLISKFSNEYYPSIKPWKEFPSINDLKDKEKNKNNNTNFNKAFFEKKSTSNL